MSAPASGPGPGARGFRMPAEWEPHAATWLAWPHNKLDWPGKFAPIPWVYGEIVRHLVSGEKVRILVNSAAHEQQARRVLSRAGALSESVEFFRIPTDRCWMRDFGPVFVRAGGSSTLTIAGVRFNAWAKYDDYHHDFRVAQRIARKTHRPFHPVLLEDPVPLKGKVLVLEGGSIDVNGLGSLLTTEECLLDQEVQARNPGASRAELERALADGLGARNVLWLSRGIAGDDTHGHVDDLCRFVNPTTVVLCRETDASDANYAALEENRERLQGFRLQDGAHLDVAFLPMPRPLVFSGQRLPASYANFYIANGRVLVPTFNDPNDRVALGVLAELFPGRTVTGIHAVDLVWGLGTLHCLSQQEPAE